MTDLLTESERATVEAVRERIAELDPDYAERAHRSTDLRNVVLAPPRLLAIIDRIAPMDAAGRVLTREQGIVECARVAWPMLEGIGPLAQYDTSPRDLQRDIRGAVECVLDKRAIDEEVIDSEEVIAWFTLAVVTRARQLVTSGACPDLRDCEALRGDHA